MLSSSNISSKLRVKASKHELINIKGINNISLSLSQTPNTNNKNAAKYLKYEW